MAKAYTCLMFDQEGQLDVKLTVLRRRSCLSIDCATSNARYSC